MENKSRAYVMEELLDSLGMVDFLEMLSGICFEKAVHSYSNWNDKILSTMWEENGIAIEKVKVHNLP